MGFIVIPFHILFSQQPCESQMRHLGVQRVRSGFPEEWLLKNKRGQAGLDTATGGERAPASPLQAIFPHQNSTAGAVFCYFCCLTCSIALEICTRSCKMGGITSPLCSFVQENSVGGGVLPLLFSFEPIWTLLYLLTAILAENLRRVQGTYAQLFKTQMSVCP